MNPLSSLHSVALQNSAVYLFFKSYLRTLDVYTLFRLYKVGQNSLSQHTQYSHYDKHPCGFSFAAWMLRCM